MYIGAQGKSVYTLTTIWDKCKFNIKLCKRHRILNKVLSCFWVPRTDAEWRRRLVYTHREWCVWILNTRHCVTGNCTSHWCATPFNVTFWVDEWRAQDAEMDANKILNGKFTFKKLPNGSIDKTKVICVLCRCELSYHRSTSSLKYHLMAKHKHSWCEFSAPSSISGPRQYFFHPFIDGQCYIVWEIICSKSENVSVEHYSRLYANVVFNKKKNPAEQKGRHPDECQQPDRPRHHWLP